MRLKSRAGEWLALCLFLAGCKGFWSTPPSSGTSGTTTASSGDFYVLNVEAKTVAGYYINAGTLTALTASPYSLPATPLAMAMAPNGKFLFVSTADGIYVYSIASNGELSLGNSSTPISSDQAISMQVSPDSSWLIEVASGAPYVYAVAINSSTGVITSKTEQFVTLPASSVQQVSISPDQTYVFVAMGSDGTAVVGFNGANTNPLGAVRRLAPVGSGGAALSVAV